MKNRANIYATVTLLAAGGALLNGNAVAQEQTNPPVHQDEPNHTLQQPYTYEQQKHMFLTEDELKAIQEEKIFTFPVDEEIQPIKKEENILRMIKLEDMEIIKPENK